MNYILLHWHDVAYLLLAIIFVVIYVVHFLPGMKNSKLRKVLEVETILMVVLIFVAVIAVRVEKVASELEKQDDSINVIVDNALRGKGLAKINQIQSASDMFNKLSSALEQSTNEIRLARMWAKSADDILTGKTGPLYKDVEEWLEKDSGRVLYRVVNVAQEGMEKWFEEECNRKRGSTNIGLKRVEGNRVANSMSFAVFDNREVILMDSPLSGPFEATKAIHIEDPVFATYMATYFDQIFEVATGCK